MTTPLSNNLRLRVVKAIDGGLSRRAAAEKFDVSVASAVRLHQRYRVTSSAKPKVVSGLAPMSGVGRPELLVWKSKLATAVPSPLTECRGLNERRLQLTAVCFFAKNFVNVA